VADRGLQPSGVTTATIDASRPFTPRAIVALVIIVVTGAALRLHGLVAESAWLDEAFAIGIARAGLGEVLYETRLDVHPPLYYFLLSGWAALGDGSVWSARLLSVVFSLGVLVATHVVGTRLAGRATGLAAAALLAASVFHIEFAQEARMYAQLTLLATLSTLGFIRLFDTSERRWFLFYVIITALMVYTHVYAMFIVGAQALTVLADVAWRRAAAVGVLGRFIAALALVFVAFLPWLPVFTWQVSLVQTSFWIAAPEPTGLLDAFRTYTGSDDLLHALLPMLAWGAYRLTRRPAAPAPPRPALLFLLPWLAGPIVFPFVLSLISSPIFLPKYTIAASVPFAILAAAGIVALPFRVLRAGALLACVALSARTLPAYYDVNTKDGWAEATPAVEALARPDDAVVVYPYFNKIAFDFYRERDDLQVRPFPLFTAPPPDDGWPVIFERATAGRDRIWFVALAADPTAQVALDQLRSAFELTSHEVRQKVAIYRFDRRP
jgi:mannosyltransferase